MSQLPRYDCRQSYQWNYDHAPDASDAPEYDPPPLPGKWTFCGRRVESPLGIAAGPLLNGRWCRYYAALGFDVVTYKTVRSGFRPCYPLPNLQPIGARDLHGGETLLPVAAYFAGSWAVSFGMPSQPPDAWRADVAATRQQLPPHKLLNVSVVGTMAPGWTLDDLADDYAACAHDAASSGADSIEINLSCPNVATCDGQLYQDARAAALVAQRVRQRIGALPLIAKIGHFLDPRGIGPLVDALAPHTNAVATTNCIAATVADGAGQPSFNGEPRGIAGAAILDASVRQTERIAEYAARQNLPLRVIGVGGIFTAADVRRYLAAGAEAVQLATAAMIDPQVAQEIRQELAQPK